MLSHTAKWIYRTEAPPGTVPNSPLFIDLFVCFSPNAAAEASRGLSTHDHGQVSLAAFHFITCEKVTARGATGQQRCVFSLCIEAFYRRCRVKHPSMS